VLGAAISLADREGIEALTMRRLAQELGVEAMSLYHYVANKDEIVNGMVDIVVEEIELPASGAEWKSALHSLATSAHQTLVRHRWAASRILSQDGVSEARLRYMEAILRTFRTGGFSPLGAHYAYHALESHIMGFTLWQVGMALDSEKLPDLARSFLQELPVDRFPYLAEHIEQHMAEEPGAISEFEFGLDLVLDGLERTRDASPVRA
jgi:AcrR family transcriptional regulator